MIASKARTSRRLAVFKPTNALLLALEMCQQAIPRGCKALKVEFDSAGMPLATAFTRNIQLSGREVALPANVSAAVTLLRDYTTFQYIMLIEALEGFKAAEAIKERFQRNLQDFGLSLGLFIEATNDSITISR